MSIQFDDIDLSNPLSDHSFWHGVQGAWIPCPQLFVPGSRCGRLYDLSCHHNHALQSNYEYSPAWKMTDAGMSIDVDGVDDFLDTTLQPTGLWSIMSVIRFDEFDDDIHGCNAGSDYRFYIGVYGEYLWMGFGDSYDRTSWKHGLSIGEVATIGMSLDNGSAHIYLNGTLLGSRSYSFVGTSPFAIRLGQLRSNDIPPYSINGQMFANVVHSRPITHTEARLFHQQSLIGYPDLIRRISSSTTFFQMPAELDYIINVSGEVALA